MLALTLLKLKSIIYIYELHLFKFYMCRQTNTHRQLNNPQIPLKTCQTVCYGNYVWNI